MLECKSMNLLNCVEMSLQQCLVLELLSIVFKMHLMSFITAVLNKNTAIPMAVKFIPKKQTYVIAIHCRVMASNYPVGQWELNGSLEGMNGTQLIRFVMT